ncbi:hypothetical protein Taro_013007 [Colocasia esculenta]|uniref:Uncharacterized protein n=1 Tax=Colocasia esculenta TaxID=4460 RepID=A0A843UHH2_COLES|nr:hypothetical protein [Colocasia esculenta]
MASIQLIWGYTRFPMGHGIQPEGSRTMVHLMGPLGSDARSEDARSAHGGRPSEARLLAIMVGPTVITSRIPFEVVLLRIGLLWTLSVALPSAGGLEGQEKRDIGWALGPLAWEGHGPRASL